MATNKVIYKGDVLIDITDSTVTADTLNEGIIAYGADGERVVGIGSGGGSGWDGVYKGSGSYLMSVGKNAFRGSDTVKEVYLTNCEYVYDYAFAESSVEKVTLGIFDGNNLKVDSYAFYNCKNLLSAELRDVTDLSQYSFAHSNIEEVLFKSYVSNYLTGVSIRHDAFANCTNLKRLEERDGSRLLVHDIGEHAFDSCENLKKLDISNCNKIGDSAFANCINFETLIIRNQPLCEISVGAFLNTKIMDSNFNLKGEGFVYVPNSMFESYITQMINDIMLGFGLDTDTADAIARTIFRKIEDYPEICG